MSALAAEADTFENFLLALMSVGKVSEDGHVSVFKDQGVYIGFREQVVLVTCKEELLLIRVRGEHWLDVVPRVAWLLAAI